MKNPVNQKHREIKIHIQDNAKKKQWKEGETYDKFTLSKLFR